MTRSGRLFPAFVLAGSMALLAGSAVADQPAAKPTGLWLTTDYPAVTEHMGDTATLSLTLANSNLPPVRVGFSLEGLPEAWKWQIDGAGKQVSAAMVGPDDKRLLDLKLTPPEGVKPGDYVFTVIGKADDGETLKLPITVTLGAASPDKITLDPKLPSLRGTPRSKFEYDVSIHNDSTEEATLNLVADAPPGFGTTFTEQYGSQEISSLPFKPGETKTVKVAVKPPADLAAGKYAVTVSAADAKTQGSTQLGLDVTGQPSMALSAEDGRLSGQAEAGKEATFSFTVSNTGTAPAKNVKISANAPSGWKVEVDPKTLDELGPGADQKIALHVTPSDKAIAGDYMVNVNSSGDGVSDHADLRVTVTTSTVWGIVGLLIIAAAVIVLAFAVTRYGRR
jgi:uncharacterized repeat protein (TIGR01451 family)